MLKKVVQYSTVVLATFYEFDETEGLFTDSFVLYIDHTLKTFFDTFHIKKEQCMFLRKIPEVNITVQTNA
jgi:hypothetical protein